MDVLDIPMISTNELRIKSLVQQIKSSNLSKDGQEALLRILHDVVEQIKQFEKYGWI